MRAQPGGEPLGPPSSRADDDDFTACVSRGLVRRGPVVNPDTEPLIHTRSVQAAIVDAGGDEAGARFERTAVGQLDS